MFLMVLGNWIQLWKDLCVKGQVDRTLDSYKQRQQRLKKKKKRIFKDFGTTMKGITYTCVMEIMKEEAREKGTEELLETIMIKNFPKLVSDTKPQIQEA